MNPRYYQQQANDATWDFLATKQGNPLVVLPTGAGKSLVIAMLCRQAIEFGGRVVVLQHRKELIQQNAEKIQILLPGVPVGVFSAGLNSKQTSQPVLCAGIQSIWKKASDIGPRHLIIVDEAHLVSSNDETMYGSFLMEAQGLTPRSRVVGLTATPYRTDEGPICGPDKLFRRICYEAMTGDLIAQGFLCPITNKVAEAQVNTEGIAIRGGEFVESDMQRAFGDNDAVSKACAEIVEKTQGRKSILIFASGVAHADQIAGTIFKTTKGQGVGVITGESLPIERAEMIRRFRSQELRWLVNCDVLTTGFDAPCVDAIAVMRATMSPGLFAQMVGRGLRKHEAKSDCLILDFGENIKRHGSLDDPSYGRVSGAGGRQGKAAEANGRGKPCLACGIDVGARATECPECGFKFPVKHQASADSSGTLTGEYPPEKWVVESVAWGKHFKRGDPEAPPTLRIDYTVKPEEGGLVPKTVSEWVCVEHEGFARVKAGLWWEVRSIAHMPSTVDEALSLLNRGACRMPSALETVRDGKYQRIKSVTFTDETPTEWADEVEEIVTDSFDGEEVPF